MKNIPLLITLAILCIAITLTAQKVELNLKYLAGASNGIWSPEELAPESKVESLWAFSQKFGMGINIAFAKRMAFEVGMDFNYLRLKDRHHYVNRQSFFNGTQVFTITEISFFNSNMTMTNFALPVAIHYHFNKLNVKLGMQVAYQFNYSGSLTGTSYIEEFPNQEIAPTTRPYRKNPFHKFDYGIVGGLGYRIFKKISINLEYYHSIRNSLNNYYTPGWERSIRQLTMGFQYHFRVN